MNAYNVTLDNGLALIIEAEEVFKHDDFLEFLANDQETTVALIRTNKIMMITERSYVTVVNLKM